MDQGLYARYWLRIVLILWIAALVGISCSENSSSKKRKRCLPTETSRIVYPLKNPSSRDIELYLKSSDKVVFVKNLRCTTKSTAESHKSDTHSLLVDIANFHASNPIISIPCISPKHRALSEIGESLNLRNIPTYNILLKYHTMKWINTDTSIYTCFDIKKQAKHIKDDFRMVKVFLSEITTCLYEKEIKKCKGDVNLVKASFTKNLKDIDLSIKNLQSIDICSDLIKSLENKEIYRSADSIDKIGEKLSKHKFIENQLFRLDSEYECISLEYEYSVFSSSLTRIRSWAMRIKDGAPEEIIKYTTFGLLKDVYILYITKHRIFEYLKKKKECNERWENPIFVRSMFENIGINDRKMFIYIEIRLRHTNEIAHRVVNCTEDNINAIKNAETQEDIYCIPISQDKKCWKPNFPATILLKHTRPSIYITLPEESRKHKTH